MKNPFGEFGDFLNDLIEEAFEPEIVTLQNDLGEEIEAEIVDYVEYEDEEYVILTEPGSDCEKIMLLKVVTDEKSGLDTYINIGDEALVNAVMNKYMTEEEDDDEFDEEEYEDGEEYGIFVQDEEDEEEGDGYNFEFSFGVDINE